MTTYLHHNTYDQAADYLRAALELIDQHEPPTDLREAFFVKAVDLLSAKAMLQTPPPFGLPRN